ncbi:SMI1/KNR4 family protein [Nonomuraea sp. NPDC049141]|uniref:SMI1/KNR4 family protein n=1 Tax=Nonomuraea sp. NPDC049141 TaxID=3155500 RepID=UPI0033ECB670
MHLLTVDQVESFEADLGVSLPWAYRDHLLRVGVGAGPYYGLFGPAEVLAMSHDPAGLFPFTRQDAKRIHADWLAWTQSSGPQGGGPSVRAMNVGGCILICDQGHDGYTALVTTGELLGTVWDFWAEGNHWRPARSAYRDSPHDLGPFPTFSAWYHPPQTGTSGIPR